VTFIDWMEIGIPFVMCMLPVTWLFLTRSFGVTGSFSGSREVITSELELLGPMQPGERRVLGIFLLTGLGWIFRDVWAASLGVEHLVHDATVAVAAALALFVLPSGNKGERLLDWQQAQTVPWGVAMIVGGGYAIAKGFATTGLATWLGDALAPIAALPLPVIVLLVVLFMTFITEINSNTATASIFLPVLATMATAGHTHPFLLMIPATFACSCAFMLPSGTGPNAVIFGSGQVTIPQMSRAGLRMNFISVVMLSVIMVLFAIPLLDISGTPPAWATLP
jgi:sodium-dependent dicarboxylate transporter 2/3/5